MVPRGNGVRAGGVGLRGRPLPMQVCELSRCITSCALRVLLLVEACRQLSLLLLAPMLDEVFGDANDGGGGDGSCPRAGAPCLPPPPAAWLPLCAAQHPA